MHRLQADWEGAAAHSEKEQLLSLHLHIIMITFIYIVEYS